MLFGLRDNLSVGMTAIIATSVSFYAILAASCCGCYLATVPLVCAGILCNGFSLSVRLVICTGIGLNTFPRAGGSNLFTNIVKC